MNNLFTIIGRVKEISEFIDNDLLEVKVEVIRNFKNVNGEYEKDIINVFVYQTMAKNINEYCSVGDLIGIKGRIQARETGYLELFAEKITFLASKRKEEENE